MFRVSSAAALLVVFLFTSGSPLDAQDRVTPKQAKGGEKQGEVTEPDHGQAPRGKRGHDHEGDSAGETEDVGRKKGVQHPSCPLLYTGRTRMAGSSSALRKSSM